MKGRKKPPPASRVLKLSPLTFMGRVTERVNPIEEEQAFAQPYLRLADVMLRSAQTSELAASESRGEPMDNPNVKVAKFEPLTFECIMCPQRFVASGKSLQQVADEVSDHLSRKHPDFANPQSEKAA